MLDSTTINNSNNYKPENLHIAKYEGVIVDAICSQAFLFGESSMSKFIRKAKLCECGCGEKTKWCPTRKQQNRFIHGHHVRVFNPSYGKDKYKEEKAKPAPLCKCGCKQRTKWNEWNKKWNDFIHNHHSRGKKFFIKEPEKSEAPLCACGCGERVNWNHQNKKYYEFLFQHRKRGNNFKEKLLNLNAPLCRCGCGNKVKWNDKKCKWRIFIQGHYLRVNPSPSKKKSVRKILSKIMLNGGAVHANSFIKSPSKPQVELFKLVKLLYPNAILNYPSLNKSIDIAIPNLMIAIEYDGSYWHQDQEADDKRQKELENIGWKFLRYIDYIPSIDELKRDLKIIL